METSLETRIDRIQLIIKKIIDLMPPREAEEANDFLHEINWGLHDLYLDDLNLRDKGV